MKKIKPQKLKKGDTIAIVSPSSGMAFRYPHRLDNAIKFLGSQGYNVKEFSSTRTSTNWESASAKDRAKDIMSAFLDTDVKAIISSIGGTVAMQTLEYLDYEKINQNPKIFCGYSDISNIHYALYTQSNLVTFYGPCLMTQFGEYPKPFDYTVSYFNKAVTETSPIGKIIPSQRWTEEILDWSKKLDLKRPRKLKKNKGYEWLREGSVKGEIIGGCFNSIIHLPGTKYWPNYQDKILFLEISEGQRFDQGEPVSYVDWYLEQLNILGIYNEIVGLIFGRPYRYNDEEEKLLKEKLLERTNKYNFPVLYGVDIGHTDPQITVPMGTEVMLNSRKNLFEFVESGVI